jgi:hypothetical protein
VNDYWNNPPEQDEIPECCGEVMEFDEETGVLSCPKCNCKIKGQPDIEPID